VRPRRARLGGSPHPREQDGYGGNGPNRAEHGRGVGERQDERLPGDRPAEQDLGLL
jgi:hypothetical protein